MRENTYLEEKIAMNFTDRITLNLNVMKGKPTIRNMRFSVAQMLELLAGGMTFEEILEDYPYIEQEDIQASLMYAAMIANARTIRRFSA